MRRPVAPLLRIAGAAISPGGRRNFPTYCAPALPCTSWTISLASAEQVSREVGAVASPQRGDECVTMLARDVPIEPSLLLYNLRM
jgi:hypothetical protein